MTKRIFQTILVVALCVFLASAFLYMAVLYDYFTTVQQKQLRAQLDLAGQGVLREGSSFFEELPVENYRLTWIGTDGSVLFDSASDAQGMENHFAREEVKQALAEGYGESSRYSSTLTERYLYSAKRLPDGTVLRIAVTQNSIWILTLGMVQPICVIIAIAALLSILLALRLSKKIVEPLNKLNLEDPLSNNGYSELTPLLRRMDLQQRQIKNQTNQLKRKQNEFESLIRGMAEGIVLLDSQGFILSINPAAEKLFPGTVGDSILAVDRGMTLSSLFDAAQSGRYAESISSIENRTYQLSANPVIQDGKSYGVVLLMLDVTDKAQAEQLRREFTANVSHELKTPLHTISGCAELLAEGLVKPEDVPEFSRRICTETRRMIQLVEDIIKLSHLDEGAEDMKWEDADLLALAEKTVAALASDAERSGVKMTVCGDGAILHGVPQLLESIIYNLCDNAIKYNRRGGSVRVTVANGTDFVTLSVADTGIGIPAEHQERIFERFYRVDKSHSKEIGGTGLGLSIVKHAARLHGAAVEVDSTPGQGTTITVKFPKHS